jgi:hypothetical protein
MKTTNDRLCRWLRGLRSDGQGDTITRYNKDMNFFKGLSKKRISRDAPKRTITMTPDTLARIRWSQGRRNVEFVVQQAVSIHRKKLTHEGLSVYSGYDTETCKLVVLFALQALEIEIDSTVCVNAAHGIYRAPSDEPDGQTYDIVVLIEPRDVKVTRSRKGQQRHAISENGE